jgi:hypothetical protein
MMSNNDDLLEDYSAEMQPRRSSVTPEMRETYHNATRPHVSDEEILKWWGSSRRTAQEAIESKSFSAPINWGSAPRCDDSGPLFTRSGEGYFMKYDNGKCRVSLVDPDFTLGVGAILTFGAQKYAANNWKLMTELERCKDAAYRHFLAYMSGELLDPESNLPHLDHLATNIMFLRYFEHGKGAQPNKGP